MNCKFCGREVAEDHEFCPFCGKKLNEEPEAPETEVTGIEAAPAEAAPEQAAENAAQSPEEKTEIREGLHLTPGKLALTIAAAVVVLAMLVAVVVSGLRREDKELANTASSDPTQSTEQTQPEETEATEPPTVPADGNPDDVTCKGTYTVTDEEAMNLSGQVAAVIGDSELTNGSLQVYYWLEVFSFLQQYGSYASYFGLDFDQSLDTQVCELTETSMTWQQYFLDSALDAWHCYESLRLSAVENGFKLDPDTQEEMEGLADQIRQVAEENGFESVEELVRQNVGAGVSLEDYVSYLETYTISYSYFDSLYNGLAVTDQQIRDYYEENKDTFTESGITEDTIYVDVRHVLLMPEGGTTDESGNTTYSDAEWEACRVKAQDVLNQYLAGEQTQEAFAALATELSEDPGSQSNGGLYECVAVGQMVEPFENWCFDESRQEGDTGLVRTTYGYHVMYFQGSQKAWIVNAREQLLDNLASSLVPDIMEAYPIQINYSNIALALADVVG